MAKARPIPSTLVAVLSEAQVLNESRKRILAESRRLPKQQLRKDLHDLAGALNTLIGSLIVLVNLDPSEQPTCNIIRRLLKGNPDIPLVRAWMEPSKKKVR